jgi:hypothetical protein
MTRYEVIGWIVSSEIIQRNMYFSSKHHPIFGHYRINVERLNSRFSFP